MEKFKDLRPAFPNGQDVRGSGCGMTLRDYFAAKAMQASLQHPEADHDESCLGAHAEWAYSMADAMLRARES